MNVHLLKNHLHSTFDDTFINGTVQCSLYFEIHNAIYSNTMTITHSKLTLSRFVLVDPFKNSS